ncbi:NAD(P)-binding protein [Lojkania enalia]|uniref:NAD(P)-binding protein n=1 Tax=Lojkania enalia TaxID=147567 RepID=A0A9P4KC56_9PLEO|nr:NAD(P)-binding protein [Didymosphaeria enalia]
MPGKIYLITGANRGLGRALFDHYVSQPDNTLIAAVRNLESAQGLLSVPKGENTRVILVKIDSASKADPFEAVEEVKRQGIESLDVVISAAGIAKFNTIEDMPLEEFEEVLMINGISVLLLYKATLPLLRASKTEGGPKFGFISGAGASLAEMEKYPRPLASHGSVKAMVNFLVKKMGMENSFLTTLIINPGLVQTDMGNMGARAAGLEKAPVTLAEFRANTAQIIDNATKAEHSGKFFDMTINRINPW